MLSKDWEPVTRLARSLDMMSERRKTEGEIKGVRARLARLTSEFEGIWRGEERSELISETLDKWDERRTVIQAAEIPRMVRLQGTIEEISSIPYYNYDVRRWRRGVNELLGLLETERDRLAEYIRQVPRNAVYLRARIHMLNAKRLMRAVSRRRVNSDRGSVPIDGILLDLCDDYDVQNYSITPEPISYVDWHLAAARYRLSLMMLREAGSICDDVLLMICTLIDDMFYVRTKGDCADIAQELPGCRVRRCLIDEMDEHEA
jgi:hypothetical protein